jgi:hypothetical protein
MRYGFRLTIELRGDVRTNLVCVAPALLRPAPAISADDFVAVLCAETGG